MEPIYQSIRRNVQLVTFGVLAVAGVLALRAVFALSEWRPLDGIPLLVDAILGLGMTWFLRRYWLELDHHLEAGGSSEVSAGLASAQRALWRYFALFLVIELLAALPDLGFWIYVFIRAALHLEPAPLG